MNSFLTEQELKSLGLRSYGSEVLISRKASFYSPQTISIGSNVRIDDFCILSGNVEIGNHVHISAYCALFGGSGIIVKDHSGLSPRCSVFSDSDDFGGEHLVGPTYSLKDRSIISGPVTINKYSQIGSGSVILPGIEVPEGFACGAMTLVNKDDLDSWSIYIGSPARKMKSRSNNIKKIITDNYG